MFTYEELIKRCNEFLWVHMYPQGSEYKLVFKSHQHRDLVRVFFAGVFETLMLLDDKPRVEALFEDYKAMCDLNWWPDDRFRYAE